MSPLDRLRALLRGITPGNRFYAPRLAAAGLTADVGSLEEFTVRLPFTTKAELIADQAANPPYGSNLTFPVENYSRFCQTSGTTARPLAVLDTAESWRWMLDNWELIYRAAGVAPGDRVYFAFSFGPFLGFWTAFDAAARLGALCIPGGGLATSARLRTIVEHGAKVLCCTPTYALHLAETAMRDGFDLNASAVRTIIVAGEPGGSIPAVRARIRSAWNDARVVDHYGLTEIGPAAFEDPNHEGSLRIIESSYFAEIIDPANGHPATSGTVGELVLTTLGRTAWPLLRYRTGDLVKRLADAPGFVLEGGIIGRSDDMIVVRGVNLYPSAIDAVVRSIPEITEYRVQVGQRGALSEVAVEIECGQDAQVLALTSALTDAFSLRIPVSRVAEGTLPRFEFKARRWVNA